MFWIYILNFIVIALVILIFWRLFLPKPDINIPPLILSDGLKVPVMGSYYSARWLQKIYKLFTIVHNELYPSLKLFDDHFEYTVLYKKSRPYSDIEKVDASSKTLMRYLIFYFKNENQVVCLNLNSEHNLKEVLKYLKSKNLNLSEEAEILI